MNKDYNATNHMEGIIDMISRARRHGLKVEIFDGKISVTNTVAYQYDMDHGEDPTQNEFAYAEYKI